MLLALSMLIASITLAEENCTETAQLKVHNELGKLLVNLPMPEGAGWCLAWNHSVEGFPVHDCYRNQGGRMVLERSHQPDFAAGLGHIPGRGHQVSDGQGGYWIEDILEPVAGDHYRLRVGSPQVNHRLVSHGEPSLRDLLNQAMQHDGICHAERYPSVGDRPLKISLSNLAANQRVTIGLYTPITP